MSGPVLAWVAEILVRSSGINLHAAALDRMHAKAYRRAVDVLAGSLWTDGTKPTLMQVGASSAKTQRPAHALRGVSERTAWPARPAP